MKLLFSCCEEWIDDETAKLLKDMLFEGILPDINSYVGIFLSEHPESVTHNIRRVQAAAKEVMELQ